MIAAKAMGIATIGLTGASGGTMKSFCDTIITVPATSTPDIQELHLPVYHALSRMLEDTFFKN
jgi:D-sedoheptulose 7-phosphate isomerase